MFRHFISLVSSMMALSTFAIEIDDYELVDLTHTYNNDTLYWPTSTTRFEKQQLFFGETEGGWFYSANAVCTPEHGGTHLDAPIHFSADGMSNEQVPLGNLIAPAVVIDISEQAAMDRNYRLSDEDVLSFERRHGRISPGTIVLLRTGWDRYWPDARAYLGDDTPGDASRLAFPGYGEDAARLLVDERGVGLLGIDTASIDYGASRDFVVHRIAAAKDVGGLENLRYLDRLPPANFTVIALPMKIEGGSGGPVRVVALVPR